MDTENLTAYLKTKPDPRQVAGQAGDDPALLQALLGMVRTARSPVRYNCTKAIRLLSEQRPEAVYPHFDDVAQWLRDANSFVKWDGILTLANLAAVDKENRFAAIYGDYFGLLRDPQMVTAANVAANAWKVAEARPDWEADITRRLLEVPGFVYLHHGEPSPECNRVLCGHILDCFDHYFASSQCQQAMLCFARAQLGSPRKSVSKSAARFVRRHGG